LTTNIVVLGAVEYLIKILTTNMVVFGAAENQSKIWTTITVFCLSASSGSG
jgi:hypothetical protein